MLTQAGSAAEIARPKASIVNAFRRRSVLLRIQAFSILGLIVVLLGAAIWIFFSAAEITKQDVATDKSFRRSSEVQSHIRNLEAKIPPEPKFVPTAEENNEFQAKLSLLESKISEFTRRLDGLNSEVVTRISSGGASVDRGVVNLARALNVSRFVYSQKLAGSVQVFEPEYATDNQVLFASLLSNNFALIDALNKKFQEITAAHGDLETFRTKVQQEFPKKLEEWQRATQKDREELAEFEEGLKLVKDQEKKQKFGLIASPQEEKNISIPFLIQTNVTRFGPMLIILFFVNILVNLYRYSIRLAAYYDARADSLELLDIKVSAASFHKFAAAVSPDALDISKPPKLPTEYALDIAKAAVGKMGSGHKD